MLTSEIRIDFHVGKVLEECKPLPVRRRLNNDRNTTHIFASRK